MARAKQVSVMSGKVFETLTEAKAYYRALRERTEIGSLVVEPERSDVLDIYQRYCAKTNYPALNAVDVTTQWNKDERASGTYATTKAFAVLTASSESKTFSMDQALREIAE